MTFNSMHQYNKVGKLDILTAYAVLWKAWTFPPIAFLQQLYQPPLKFSI